MGKPQTRAAFTPEEWTRAHELLSARVAFMMGRKFEEGDWSEVYCLAKGIPCVGWSNLNIDVMHNGLGVEFKMICYRSKPSLREACGLTLMHPAATRSIRVPTPETKPNKAMRAVLTQYGDLLEQRRKKVRETAGGAEPDMRTGWLLWQESLREFLYFEEEMLNPDPADYYAEWVEHPGGVRKASVSLWVYEKKTGRKRYSITTEAGAKIQPYFDVPSPQDPNLYIFTAQGEVVASGLVRIWVSEAAAYQLGHILGNLDPDRVSEAILQASRGFNGATSAHPTQVYSAQPIFLAGEAYEALRAMFPGGVSDYHLVELFVQYLRQT